jgi:hypothetical protein
MAKAKKAGRAHKGQLRKKTPVVKKPKGGY